MKSIQFRQIWTTQNIRKILFWNFCLISLVVGGFYACTDHDTIKSTDVTKYEEPIVPRSPSTTGDRVLFSDFDNFEDYYMSLESMLSSGDGDYFDSIVNLTTSVSTLNDVIATTIGSFGVITDQVLRGIINPYNEFQIDDILVTVVNDNQWLMSDASNGTLKTAIRGMTKGDAFDTGDIPAGAQWVAPYELEDGLRSFWCGCRVRIERLSCTEIRVYGSCSGFFGSNGGGEITITFDPDGLGGPVELENEEVGNNFEYIINISQLHGMVGIVTAVAESNCEFELGPYPWEFYFDPAEFEACDYLPRELTQTITNGLGSERMIITTAFRRNAFADVHSAEITSESNDGGGWDKSSANMTVGVEANRKSPTCELEDSKDDQEHKTRKHIVVRVSWFQNCWHCDGDLLGTFEKIKNGTLEETQDVDFHCCEQ